MNIHSNRAKALLGFFALLILVGIAYWSIVKHNTNLEKWENAAAVIPAGPISINQQELAKAGKFFPWRLEVAVRSGNGEYSVARLSNEPNKETENGTQLGKVANTKGAENLTLYVCLPFQDKGWEMPAFQTNKTTFTNAAFGWDGVYYAIVDGEKLIPTEILTPHTGGDASTNCAERGVDPRDDSEQYDLEPKALEIRTANSRFLKARVTITTSKGRRSGVVPWGDCKNPSKLGLANPGNLKGGYTVTISTTKGKTFKFAGKRTTAYDPAILSLSGMHQNGNPGVFIEQDTQSYRIADWRHLKRVK